MNGSWNRLREALANYLEGAILKALKVLFELILQAFLHIVQLFLHIYVLLCQCKLANIGYSLIVLKRDKRKRERRTA